MLCRPTNVAAANCQALFPVSSHCGDATSAMSFPPLICLLPMKSPKARRNRQADWEPMGQGASDRGADRFGIPQELCHFIAAILPLRIKRDTGLFQDWEFCFAQRWMIIKAPL